MSQTINSGIYKQGLKWDLLTKNKIDTFTCQPVKNTATESQTVATADISYVNVGGTEYRLPITNRSLGQEKVVAMYNPANVAYSLGKVIVVPASGSVTITLEQPLAGTVTASMELQGTTYHINRGEKTHLWYQQLYNSSNPTERIVGYASGTETWDGSKSTDSVNRGSYTDPYLVDYTQATVPLFPYVRKITEASSTSENLPDEQDVLTRWIPECQTSVSNYARRADWTTIGSTYAATVDMWPPSFATIDPAEAHTNQQIRIHNDRAVNSCAVAKVDDYTYTVNFTIPARYTYLASSTADSYIDNYAFVDRITKVVISLNGSTLDTDTTDISYSLDSNGDLTETVKNTYPVSFEQNELITLGTTTTTDAGTGLWTTVVAEDILTKYKNGKYIVKCTVPATWAITNNIHVGSEIIVRLLDGTYITRNSSNVVFRVKNIEKVFSGSKFEYNLSLKEK